MFLLDPQAGQQRRQRAINAAHDAMDSVERGWHTASRQAHAVAERVSASGRDLNGAIADRANRVQQAANDSAAHFANLRQDLKRRGRHVAMALRDESHLLQHAGAITASALGCGVLGAAAMFLFDPERGRARRARISQGVSGVLNATSRRAHGLGAHLGNKARGIAAESGLVDVGTKKEGSAQPAANPQPQQ